MWRELYSSYGILTLKTLQIFSFDPSTHFIMSKYTLRWISGLGLLRFIVPEYTGKGSALYKKTVLLKVVDNKSKAFQARSQNCEKRLLASGWMPEIPSVCTKQLGFHRTNFLKIWYLSIFRISVEKKQISLKWDKNNGYFTWRPIYIFDHILLIIS
jgi:hypothetical protein